MSSQKPPMFITLGVVRRRLGLVNSRLPFDEFPRLYIAQNTRLFIAEYVNAYAGYLQKSGQRVTPETGHAFAEIPLAQIITLKVIGGVDAALAKGDELTLQQVMELLNVDRTTVESWRRAKPKVRIQQRRGNRGSARLEVISVQELQNAMEWRLPGDNN